MIIHFFTKGDKNLGSSRQRVFLVAEELKKRGWRTIVHQPSLTAISVTPWPRKAKLIFWLASVFLKNIKKGDIIFVHKGINNKYFLVLLAVFKVFFKRKVISDFDDAVFLHSPRKTKLLIKLSDIAIAGSHYIYDWICQHHHKVFFVPTSVEYSCYSKFSRDYSIKPEVPVIGWVGHGPAHYVNLRHLPPVFEELLKLKINFRFILIGALKDPMIYKLFDIPGLKTDIVDTLNWEEPENVAVKIHNFDIGVMPLEDVSFERGKCAFKAIEYMACGVATIASGVGENKYLIKDGVNGLLARNWSDWAPKIKLLLADYDLRKKIGQAGQKTIKEKYSFEANIPALEKIIKLLFNNP